MLHGDAVRLASPPRRIALYTGDLRVIPGRLCWALSAFGHDWFAFLGASTAASGQVRFRHGDQPVDRYLEFMAGPARPNTLRSAAFDLKTFFGAVGKDPWDVAPADVFDFLAQQRADRSVVRPSDRESRCPRARFARRLSSGSGFYAYAIACGDTVCVGQG